MNCASARGDFPSLNVSLLCVTTIDRLATHTPLLSLINSGFTGLICLEAVPSRALIKSLFCFPPGDMPLSVDREISLLIFSLSSGEAVTYRREKDVFCLRNLLERE